MSESYKIDLHMHSTISDGTDAPEDLLVKVRNAGICVFSITDHDAITSSRVIPDLLQNGDPGFLSGVEFSCKDEEGKYHILGYGYDPEAEAIRNVVEAGHTYRMQKVHARLDYLRNHFGITFPEEEIAKLLAMPNPGKPHIGNLMVRYGFADTKEQAIEEYIDKIHFQNEYVRPEEAIEGILKSDGIPVLAHPFYGSGGELILGDDMDHRLQRLIGFGLCGVEAFYSGFSKQLQDEMLSFADKYDLFVTAGSDYHGTNKMIELGDHGLFDMPQWPEGLKRFLAHVL